ncbi:MAG: DNA topoisomerase VI subunit B [Candidatus Thermoplasmatota archaeon]|nr:DNA topoisomerase VI subunit B [Candidatus Thermoplasmatota archaeon]
MKPIAEELAKKQREISVAEFFEKNKHILGFDSTTRAILTAVKEAVDNSLDACEEANVMPEVLVEITQTDKKGVYTLKIEDNGPGIVKQQISNVFGRLLYGSRFHAIRQSRGQQGIGISAAVLYSQLTTGKPTRIISKIAEDRPAHVCNLMINTRQNMPEVVSEDITHWEKPHGTSVEMQMIGKYLRDSKQSPYEFLKNTAIVNPHARIVFKEPDGTVTTFERVAESMPKPCTDILPHPHGVEIGTVMKMLSHTSARKLGAFLQTSFCRISQRTSDEICQKAGLDSNLKPEDMGIEQISALVNAFKEVKLMAPPTDCLSPIGEILLKRALKRNSGTEIEFAASVTRAPSVYSGNPFIVEVAVAYCPSLPKDQTITIMRFANRVPLLFQQGACALTHGIEGVDWRRYGLDQRGGKGIPSGPVMMLVHVASTKVPFTSESKEAVADIPEIEQDIALALQECGRALNRHMHKNVRIAKLREKETIIKQLLPLIAQKSAHVLNRPVPSIEPVIAKIMNSILVDSRVEYIDGNRKTHKVFVDLINYTKTGHEFNLYAVVPEEAKLAEGSGATAGANGKLSWKVKMEPDERKSVIFELSGLEKDDYTEADIYFDGIESHIIDGIDPWKEEEKEEVYETVDKSESVADEISEAESGLACKANKEE